jgi:hypothetical protein
MADDSEDWITAREAVKLLKPVTGDEYSAQMTICARAYDKLISARAVRLVVEDHNWRPVKMKEVNDVEVPPKFWWARGHEALTQNWSTGDFETWIDKRAHYKGYGVKFLRADIMSMVSPDLADTSDPIASRLAEGFAAARAPQSAPARGTKIFIGHGHSLAWRDLKDFIVERLKLPYDEFKYWTPPSKHVGKYR